MKITLIAAASVAAMTIGSNTASAQPAVVVPHRNHYHVVPANPQPVYGYGYRGYSSGFYASPGYSFNSYSPGFGYSSGFYSPGFGYGSFYGGSWGGHHHHHHGHHHPGHHHHGHNGHNGHHHHR